MTVHFRVGEPVRWEEDPRLPKRAGRYVDDIALLLGVNELVRFGST